MTSPGEHGRPTLWLHIGAMKTGTTYLQQLLYANRDALTAAGLTLPGETWSRQVRGVQDVMRMDRRDRHIRRQSKGAWDELVHEAAAADRALISVEFLSFCGRRRVRDVLRTLEGFDVRVLLTVRDMSALLPSQWQTLVHNQARFSWADYLAAVPEPGVPSAWATQATSRARRQFQRTQNIPRMLTIWADAVPPGSLQVVTVPTRGAAPGELWRRYAGVVGVDPAVATQAPEDSNPSLGQASTELIRRMNRHLRGLPRSEYNWTVKEVVALDHLVRRAPTEGRARLTRAGYDLALRWNAMTRETVERTGAGLTGDPDADLPVVADPEVRAALPERAELPDPETMLDAGQLVARELSRLSRRRARRLRAVGVDAHATEHPGPGERRRRWAAAGDPVGAAAEDLAEQAREAALLLRRLREQRRSAATGT